MADHSLRIVVMCALLGASVAQAQQLRDPTRPPSFVVSTERAAPFAGDPGLVLQTVLISPQRRNATISGRLLYVGDSIAGMRLTEIRESAVVLRGDGRSRTLELFPAVAKRRTEVAREPEPVRKKPQDDAG